MKIIAGQSPNFAPTIIQPEFVVVHYTACGLERALEIFSDRCRKVCAHFVLAENGDLHDLGNFWDGPILQGAHAGDSFFELNGKRYEKLNEFSVGIEIVNTNGNLLPFTDAQYETLSQALRHLARRFPLLSDPARIVGHEHIAGFRGKVDPGRQFDWSRMFRQSFGSGPFPERKPLLSAADEAELRAIVEACPEENRTSQFWSELSAGLERKFGRKS